MSLERQLEAKLCKIFWAMARTLDSTLRRKGTGEKYLKYALKESL